MILELNMMNRYLKIGKFKSIIKTHAVLENFLVKKLNVVRFNLKIFPHEYSKET